MPFLTTQQTVYLLKLIIFKCHFEWVETISNIAFSRSLDSKRSLEKYFMVLLCFHFDHVVLITQKNIYTGYQYTKMIFSVKNRMCSIKVVLNIFCVLLVPHKPFVTTVFFKRPELLFSYKYKILDHLFSDSSEHSYGHSYGGTSQTKVSIYCNFFSQSK